MNAVRLVDADLKPICSALLLKPCVVSLDLRYNRLTNLGAKTLAEFLLVGVRFSLTNLYTAHSVVQSNKLLD